MAYSAFKQRLDGDPLKSTRSTTSLPGKTVTGSINIHFGGCDGRIPNCLPITNSWNYMVRLYRPARRDTECEWKFPEAPAGELNVCKTFC